MLRLLGRILYLLTPFLVTALLVGMYRQTHPPAPDDPYVMRAMDSADFAAYSP